MPRAARWRPPLEYESIVGVRPFVNGVLPVNGRGWNRCLWRSFSHVSPSKKGSRESAGP